MAQKFTKDPGRQYPLTAVIEINFDDTNAAGTSNVFQPGVANDTPVIDLPAGAVVIGGYVECDTAWTSASSPTLNIKVGGVSYLASAINLTAGTGAAVVPTGTKLTAAGTVDTTIGGSGTATAGKARIIVQYVVLARANEVRG